VFKGFKDFILRGNVIELSIAVVVGTAFTALVAAFTTNIVNPIIAAAGGVQTEGLGFEIWAGNDKTFVNIGGVITALVTFLITAAVVYFIFVAPMNKINALVKQRLATEEPEEEPIPADTALLAEIRDLLTKMAEADRTSENSANRS
jgi:large conductance mechanosensitive channel